MVDLVAIFAPMATLLTAVVIVPPLLSVGLNFADRVERWLNGKR